MPDATGIHAKDQEHQLETPLIPLQVLMGNPVQTSPKLSPDGKSLAFLAENADGIMNVFVQAVADPNEQAQAPTSTQITNETHRSLREFFWSRTPGCHRLFFLQDHDGDENFHLKCADFELDQSSGQATHIALRDLTPFANTRVMTIEMHHDFPDRVLATMNQRDPTMFDICRIDVGTGTVTIEVENPGLVVSWFVDKNFEVAACTTKSQEDGSCSLWIRPEGSGAQAKTSPSEWNRIATWPQDEVRPPIMFNHDGSGFYVKTSQCHDGTNDSHNTSGLVLLSTKDGRAVERLARDDKCDVSTVCANDHTRTIDYVVFDYTKPRVEIINEANREDLERLINICHGAFGLVSRSMNDHVWIFSDTCDNESLKYYIYWRDSRKHMLLFDTQPELSKYTLASMTAHVIKTSDGEDMVVYMSLPPGVQPKKLPFVLMVHGGPWARDIWGYDPEHQFFTNRGYGCLSVNFRASTGYGKRWLNMGNKQWGGAMQQDLTDGVHWAIDQGYADKDRFAIYGASYGGYATLAGLAFTPDLFCCGIDISGPSHLKTLLEKIPPYWSLMFKQLLVRMGDMINDDQLNRQASPLFHAHKICKPLMIVQGANDPRVPKAEADQIARALFQNKHDVKYTLYEDEGHFCVRQPNVMDQFFRMEAFLADHLGGRLGVKDVTLTEGHSGVEIDVGTL